MRGAHDRELLGAPAVVGDGAVGEPGLRLQRFGRRAPEGDHTRWPRALDDLPVRRGECGARPVQALDGGAAPGLDKDLGVLDGLDMGCSWDDWRRVYRAGRGRVR